MAAGEKVDGVYVRDRQQAMKRGDDIVSEGESRLDYDASLVRNWFANESEDELRSLTGFVRIYIMKGMTM